MKVHYLLTINTCYVPEECKKSYFEIKRGPVKVISYVGIRSSTWAWAVVAGWEIMFGAHLKRLATPCDQLIV